MNGQTKGIVTTVRLTGDDAQRLRKVAEREDRSMSSVIRLAVRQYLEIPGRWLKLSQGNLMLVLMRQRSMTNEPLLCAATIQSEPCDRPARSMKSGLCHMHYQRQQKGTAMDGSPYQKRNATPCAVEGCDALVVKRQWCDSHYARWRVYGDPEYVPAERIRATCQEEDCESPAAGRGLCMKHYQRLRSGGKFTGEQCAVPGCDRGAHSRGWCMPHHKRWRRHGDPTAGGVAKGSVSGSQCAADECGTTAKATAADGRKLCQSHYDKTPEQRLRALEKTNRRNAIKRRTATVYPIPPAAIQGRIEVLNNRCWLCGDALDEDMHLDHVKPLSKNGPHVAANLRPTCDVCNMSKGAQWPFDTSTAHLRLDPARLP